MKKITIVWTITLLIVVGGLTAFGFKLKAEKGDSIMEKSLVTQAEKYMGLYVNLFPQKGKTFKITNEELKQDGYNAELEKDCDGYVVISNDDGGYKYKAYVKCPNYTTDGYDSAKSEPLNDINEPNKSK